MFVMPAEGRAVRVPELNHALMPATGQDVPPNDYWLRRLRDADVVEAEPPAEEAAPIALSAPAAEAAPAGDPA